LRVNSNVRGAEIFVDGEAVGQAPRTVRVKRGRITLKVTADGYKDYVTRLNITRNTTVAATLRRERRDFTLRVSANVRRARVYVNDKYLGQTPFRTTIREGEHFIKVTAPGFEDYTETIQLDQNRNINAKLERLRRFYNLSISADVRRARVWINGEPRKGFAPLTVKLEEGTYEIKVQAQRRRPFVTTVELNRNMRIKADLKPETAKIRVIIPDEVAGRGRRGRPVAVFLDGKPQKDLEFEVERGRHTVRVQAGNWFVEKPLSCREGRIYTLRPEFVMDVSEEEIRD
jgi:hypothetical protein